ncbi:MAG: YgjV family protein [Oscillospiraceae bacterium]|nr:YgjV family protein [Oscillospiraceae bacterium]
MEIAAHIVGLAALTLAVISLQQRTHKYILSFQIAATTAWLLHYLMLGAFTGAFLNAIAMIRSVVFVNKGKKWADNRAWLWGFCAICIIAGILTWDGPASILPILGMLCTTVAFWIKTPKYVRMTAFPSSPLWLVYNLINKSYAGAAAEIINMCSIIIAYIRLDMNKDTQKTEKQ